MSARTEHDTAVRPLLHRRDDPPVHQDRDGRDPEQRHPRLVAAVEEIHGGDGARRIVATSSRGTFSGRFDDRNSQQQERQPGSHRASVTPNVYILPADAALALSAAPGGRKPYSPFLRGTVGFTRYKRVPTFVKSKVTTFMSAPVDE